MNVSDLPELPTEEGLQAEFRLTADPATLAKTVAAMFNGGGGLVMVGYDDDGAFVGVPGDPDVELRRLREGLERAIVPREPLQITVAPGPGGAGFLIEVPEGAQKPYLVGGAIYVRTGSATRTATSNEITRLVTQRGKAEGRWERQPAVGAGADVLSEQIVREAFAMARRRLDLSEPIDDALATALDGLKLSSEGWPTRAALALFVRPEEVPQHLPQARAQVVRFEEDSPEGRIERVEHAGGAAVLIEPLLSAVVGALPRVMVLPTSGVRREDRPTYPEGAIREGLLNALMHRDYADDGFVSVRLFPDRIEIWNPGKIDGAFLAGEEARLVSRPTNPDVARVFNLLAYGEGTGIGLWRIRTAMETAGLPVPTWENRTRGVLLTLRTHEGGGSAVAEPLAPRLAAFVGAVEPGDRLTRAEYQGRFAPDVSDRTANEDIRGLLDAGYLRQEGSGPSTAYVRTAKTYDHPDGEAQ